MADARKCDRCGAFYIYFDNNYNYSKRHMITITNGDTEYDLCKNCLDKLDAWFDGEESDGKDNS